MLKKITWLMITAILMNFMFISICFSDVQTNNDNLRNQTEMLTALLEEVKVLNEIIALKRKQVESKIQINQNTSTVQNQTEHLQIIFEELKAIEYYLIPSLEEVEKAKDIRKNIEAIKKNTRDLQMLLRELKAMNQLVVAHIGDNLINCTTGQVFNLIFTGKNLKDATEITYIITYDTREVEIVDLCGATSEQDINEGQVPDTNINIVSLSEGKIVFTVTKTVSTNKSWSGIINNIKFKSKKDGKVIINSKMKIEEME